MRSLPPVVVVLLVFLAGCSASPPAAEAPAVDFDELELEATATTGIIRGIVVDAAIRPVGNATVMLTPGDKTAVSTDAGTFGFDTLEPGTYFLKVERLGYNATQTSTEVVAGESEPPIIKVLLTANPSTVPYLETYAFNGFLSFGAAIFLTSIGTTITSITADTLGDTSIWTIKFAELPEWAQGELVWEQTQPLGGEFIWEMTDTTNTHYGYRETTGSPALAYWNTTVFEDEDIQNSTLDPDRGIAYRFFGGPHPLCKTSPPLPNTFGCGLTVQQRADVYIHNFYNFVPTEGWRFTMDGEPEVPQ
ncbi:MAG TPA: carboxypeptidase-like regulatory domain-containing protein [Candidatus Thermoplasmatota archaeon]|nr:carboxypeptidase-like regulatory domain-containing protein [Candidatus Thermoplasmatota archaeon]